MVLPPIQSYRGAPGGPLLRRIAQAAWILRPDGARQPAGFVGGTDLPPHEFHACLTQMREDD